MSLDTLRLLRNILLRAALIAYIFAIAMGLSTMVLWNTWTTMTTQMFHTNIDTLAALVANFFAAIKFYAIFILLTPGLALHWTIKAQSKS